jgi:hypothetical protein
MVAVTYGVARVAAPAAAGAKTGKVRRGIFMRVIDAIAYSQMKRAERELARYRHLLPHDHELNRDLWSLTGDKLPYGGW